MKPKANSTLSLTLLLKLFAAYGKVFLVRKRGGHDHGTLYAMKVLKKASIVQKKKTAEHTMTERQVLEAVRQSPFLVTLYYAFQTDAKLHLILGKSGSVASFSTAFSAFPTALCFHSYLDRVRT